MGDNTPQGDTQQVRSATKETTQQATAELASGKVEDRQAEALATLQNDQTGEPPRGSNEEAVPEASAAAARKVRIEPNVASAKAMPKAKAKQKAKDNTTQGDTQQVRSATKETTQQANAELASGKVEDRQAEALATLQKDQTGEPPRGSNEEAVPEASAAAARKVRIEPNAASAKAMPKAKAKRKAKDNTPQGDTQQVRSAKKETTQQANAELASGKVED